MEEKENILISELIIYAKELSKENLEHLVWIGEGMCHASKCQNNKEEQKNDTK